MQVKKDYRTSHKKKKCSLKDLTEVLFVGLERSELFLICLFFFFVIFNFSFVCLTELASGHFKNEKFTHNFFFFWL